jgi:hypothetical protein
VAGAGAKFLSRLAVFVKTILAEAGVGLLIVVSEIEVVLDERRARERVISYAVSAHPGIQHEQRKQEEQEEKALRFARTWLRRSGQSLRLREAQLHETSPGKTSTQDASCAQPAKFASKIESCSSSSTKLLRAATRPELEALSLFEFALSCWQFCLARSGVAEY